MFGFDDWGPEMMDDRHGGAMMRGGHRGSLVRDYDGSGMMDGSGGWLAMLLGFLLLLALIGIAIFLIARATGPARIGSYPAPPAPSTGPAPSTSSTGRSPREELDLRLARGDITPEGYSATRQLIDS